jgi:TonB family protein
VPETIGREYRVKLAAPRAGKTSSALYSPHFRQRAAATVIALASLVWVSGLAALGYAQSALPWCITLAVTACGAILNSRKSTNPFAPQAVISAERQPLSFMESYAATYLVVSLVLSSWIVYHLLYKPPPLKVVRQVVDIQLSSLADVIDRKDPLPGMTEKDELRKRTASVLTSHGSLTALPSSVPTVPHPTPARVDGADSRTARTSPDKTQSKTPQLTDAKMIVVQPLKQSPSEIAATNQIAANNPMQVKRMLPAAPQPKPREARDGQPFLEEVQPPEMVEMIDNDGTNALDVWQAGGHSSGGSGSRSDLVAYLRDVNRRIKSAWSPPRGAPWKTEILFRIRKPGQLASARVTRSSGNAEADEAAMKAVVASAPFRELPADYPHAYLDLRYSFNYSVDQLTDVTDAQPH